MTQHVFLRDLGALLGQVSWETAFLLSPWENRSLAPACKTTSCHGDKSSFSPYL